MKNLNNVAFSFKRFFFFVTQYFSVIHSLGQVLFPSHRLCGVVFLFHWKKEIKVWGWEENSWRELHLHLQKTIIFFSFHNTHIQEEIRNSNIKEKWDSLNIAKSTQRSCVCFCWPQHMHMVKNTSCDTHCGKRYYLIMTSLESRVVGKSDFRFCGVRGRLEGWKAVSGNYIAKASENPCDNGHVSKEY